MRQSLDQDDARSCHQPAALATPCPTRELSRFPARSLRAGKAENRRTEGQDGMDGTTENGAPPLAAHPSRGTILGEIHAALRAARNAAAPDCTSLS
jgi:hypothetical protein